MNNRTAKLIRKWHTATQPKESYRHHKKAWVMLSHTQRAIVRKQMMAYLCLAEGRSWSGATD